MSYERLEKNFLPTKADDKKPVLCVGTTALRCLESLPMGEKKSRAESFEWNSEQQYYGGRTQLFVRPGFEFQFTDALLTNFHLPQSSLLVLVSCFAGSWELVKESYERALSKNYRFFSYGDATLWI
jgi:S-adenosylmethionine:tRNA ribosyltransferase-isomerase